MTLTPLELAYLVQGDQNALNDWAMEHWHLHERIHQKAVDQGKQNLTFSYSVPDMVNMDDWLYFHNEEHQAIAEAFNLGTPPDLTFWDFQDSVNFNNWLFSHALIHDSAKKVLNL